MRSRYSRWARTSCIIGGDTCGPNQVSVDRDVYTCVCRDGAAPDPDGTGCVLCGDNEEVVDEACACKAGFGRASPDAPCEETAAGASCADDSACTDPFPYCSPDADEGRYCTARDCTANADCPSGYYLRAGGRLALPS